MQVSALVAGDYVLEVQMLSHSNPTNIDASGRCCDFYGDCTKGSRRCDTYFRFCLRPFLTVGTDRTCTTAAVISSHVSDNGVIDFTQPKFLGLDNPLLLAGLSTAWQVKLCIIMCYSVLHYLLYKCIISILVLNVDYVKKGQIMIMTLASSLISIWYNRYHMWTFSTISLTVAGSTTLCRDN